MPLAACFGKFCIYKLTARLTFSGSNECSRLQGWGMFQSACEVYDQLLESASKSLLQRREAAQMDDSGSFGFELFFALREFVTACADESSNLALKTANFHEWFMPHIVVRFFKFCATFFFSIYGL
jgi:hypothetical protein